MPKGQKTQTQQKTIELEHIKKYLEQGYQANWGEGYIWTNELVILRKQHPDHDEVEELYNYVVITPSNVFEIIGAKEFYKQ